MGDVMGLPVSPIAKRMKKVALYVLLGETVLSTGAAVSFAQSQSPFAIRVEAPEVVVPVVVEDRTYFRRLADTIFEELDEEITDLSAADFQVFEGGVKQPIRNVAVELPRYWDARDNVSHHVEQSSTPRGIWAGPDLWPQSGPSSTLSASRQMYLVSYVPPASPEGSCRRIKVKVAWHYATVYAREEYCNEKHPPFDPMYGTKLGKRMEAYEEPAEAGRFPVSVQTGFFPASPA